MQRKKKASLPACIFYGKILSASEVVFTETEKWIIASDIHGAVPYCEQLLTAFETEKADKMLLLGDYLYHGPRNELPDGYRTKDVSAMLNDFSKKHELMCVRGNCDAEVDQYVLEFPIVADYLVLFNGDADIFATHGHIYDEYEHPYITPGTVLLHGHTHIPACVEMRDFTYINPGSVSIPRGGSERSYIVFDGKTFIWKNLCGVEYKKYELKEGKTQW